MIAAASANAVAALNLEVGRRWLRTESGGRLVAESDNATDPSTGRACPF
jgi:hypothetical protein